MGEEDLPEDSNTKKFNLTWECTKYFEDEMLIQINFTNPLWISSSRDVDDKLMVNLKDQQYFRSNYTRSRRDLQEFEDLDMS